MEQDDGRKAAELEEWVEGEFAVIESVAKALFTAEHPDAEWSSGRARIVWFDRAATAVDAVRPIVLEEAVEEAMEQASEEDCAIRALACERVANRIRALAKGE